MRPRWTCLSSHIALGLLACLGHAAALAQPATPGAWLWREAPTAAEQTLDTAAFQAADTEIAILYGDVMRALSAHERPQLRQEHTAWQRERTTRCKQATRSAESQPQWPRLYHACLTTETEARRKGLMRWLTLDHPSAKP